MSTTLNLVKDRINAWIRDAIAALPMVGEASIIDTGETADLVAGRIGEALRAGKFACMIGIGADVLADGERQALFGVDRWMYPVAIQIRLPDSLPYLDAEQPELGRMRPDQAALWIHTEILKTYTGNNDNTAGNLAIRLECDGGGGAYFIDDGSGAVLLIADHLIMVEYRHKSGEPGVAA